MNVRVLRIELRRSVAPWAGVVVLTVALAFLYLLSGPWWKGTALWTTQWTSMALWTRFLLVFLWPLAVALGALQGLRDHRSRMSELLTSTPRPARHRAATTAGATAIALASAFALLVLLGAVQVLGDTEYTHLGWLPISLVGGLALVAGAVLGMGVGRNLPSPLTPPALAVAAFVFVNLLRVSTESGVATAALPTRVALLSPAVDEVRDVFLTLSAPVHLGQSVWLLGMALTGLALLAAATPRARLLALVPVLAGAAIALLVLPADPRRTYVVDEAAAAQVCDGPVCLATAHQDRLPGLAGPGKKALRLLRDVLGGEAPTSVRESTAPRAIFDPPERSRTSVLVDFDDSRDRRREGRGTDPGPARAGHGAALLRPQQQRERHARRDRRAGRGGGLGPRGPQAVRRGHIRVERATHRGPPGVDGTQGAAVVRTGRTRQGGAHRRRLLRRRPARRPGRRYVPVRWLTLYARSRQVPASLAAVVISAVAVWALVARDGGGGPADPRLPVFVLVAGVTAASAGLGGQDLALDRTAAIRWRPRRAAHVLLIGMVVCAVLLAVQAMGGQDLATTAFVVRDSAGLMGLAALGAVVCGAAVRVDPAHRLAVVLGLRPAPDERADAGGDLDAAAARHDDGHVDGPGPRGHRHGGLRPRGAETVTGRCWLIRVRLLRPVELLLGGTKCCEVAGAGAWPGVCW